MVDLQLFDNKRVAFLENGEVLDDLCQELADYMDINNILYNCIFDIERRGLDNVIDESMEFDILIYHTTWAYNVSRQLKEYFMRMTNPNHKKEFIELFIDEPSFYYKPNNIIHDIYVLDLYEKPPSEWIIVKLDNNISFWEL